MNPSNAVKHICRACGQRSTSSFQANGASTASRARRLHRPSSTKFFSHTSTRPVETTTTSSSTSSETPPPPLASSILPSNTAPTHPAPQPPKSEPIALINPFPPLPPTSKTRTTTGTVSRIHTSTARVERNILSWDKHLQKYYTRTTHDLVHDPLSLLRVGDVVKYSFFTPHELSAREKAKSLFYSRLEAKGVQTGRGEKVTKKGFVVPEGKRLVMVGAKLEAINRKQRNSRGVRFVVREVVTPFGNSVKERMGREGEGVRKMEWLVEMEREEVARQRVREVREESRKRKEKEKEKGLVQGALTE